MEGKRPARVEPDDPISNEGNGGRLMNEGNRETGTQANDKLSTMIALWRSLAVGRSQCILRATMSPDAGKRLLMGPQSKNKDAFIQQRKGMALMSLQFSRKNMPARRVQTVQSMIALAEIDSTTVGWMPHPIRASH